MDSDGTLTSGEWKMHAEKQTVRFPEDRSVLPADLKLPMPWPEILQDYERMKPLQWNKLWLEYSKQHGLPAKPVDEPYDARKIGEQWVVFWGCLALSAAAAFILLRTLGRWISADAEGITTQQGRRIPYADLKTFDLRKWETKGLAFLDYDGTAGNGPDPHRRPHLRRLQKGKRRARRATDAPHPFAVFRRNPRIRPTDPEAPSADTGRGAQ